MFSIPKYNANKYHTNNNNPSAVVPGLCRNLPRITGGFLDLNASKALASQLMTKRLTARSIVQ